MTIFSGAQDGRTQKNSQNLPVFLSGTPQPLTHQDLPPWREGIQSNELISGAHFLDGFSACIMESGQGLAFNGPSWVPAGKCEFNHRKYTCGKHILSLF